MQIIREETLEWELRTEGMGALSTFKQGWGEESGNPSPKPGGNNWHI